MCEGVSRGTAQDSRIPPCHLINNSYHPGLGLPSLWPSPQSWASYVECLWDIAQLEKICYTICTERRHPLVLRNYNYGLQKIPRGLENDGCQCNWFWPRVNMRLHDTDWTSLSLQVTLVGLNSAHDTQLCDTEHHDQCEEHVHWTILS